MLRGGAAVADACIAVFNGTVALALASTLLLIAVLGGSPTSMRSSSTAVGRSCCCGWWCGPQP